MGGPTKKRRRKKPARGPRRVATKTAPAEDIALSAEASPPAAPEGFRAELAEFVDYFKRLIHDLRTGIAATRPVVQAYREVSRAWRARNQTNNPLWFSLIFVAGIGSSVLVEWQLKWFFSDPSATPAAFEPVLKVLGQGGPQQVLVCFSIAVKLIITGILLHLPSPVALVISLANLVVSFFTHYDARLLALIAGFVPHNLRHTYLSYFDSWAWLGLAFAAVYPTVQFLFGTVQQAAAFLPYLSVRPGLAESPRLLEWRTEIDAARRRRGFFAALFGGAR